MVCAQYPKLNSNLNGEGGEVYFKLSGICISNERAQLPSRFENFVKKNPQCNPDLKS